MARKNEEGLSIQEYSKGEYLPMESNDLSALIDLSLSALETRTGKEKYPNTEEGLQLFKERSNAYLVHVQRVNSNPDLDKKLLVDIESWAVYCQITRATIHNYSKRGGEWADFIDFFREIIAMCKKQLASSYKVPPMFAMFDLVNNHDYHNTNEFKLQTVIEDTTPTLTEAELLERAEALPGFRERIKEG